MISIDVQTDVKNSKNPDGQNRLWVANQERSVQETLYDGGAVDLIGSHNFIASAVKLVDASAGGAGPGLDSKGQLMIVAEQIRPDKDRSSTQNEPA